MSKIQNISRADDWKTGLEHEISLKFVELLSTRHLYQSVALDQSRIKALAPLFQATTEVQLSGKECEERVAEILALMWIPDCNGLVRLSRPAESGWSTTPLEFKLPPTITTDCQICEDRHPFNPVLERCRFDWIEDDETKQLFLLSYVCQNCKGEPVRFMVKREGLRLRLCGRSPIERVTTPKFLPKDASQYFAGAQVAHNSGQTLAGIFLLRVFLEQFLRSRQDAQVAATSNPRISGDELAKIYQSSLPPSFNSEFPSLREAYNKLSESIHSADPSVAVFDEWTGKIIDHFDARRLLKLL